jgi:cold shock CspA family protein
MAKSKETFGKKDKENKKAKKRKEKMEKKEERKMNNNKGKGLDMMMAYVDEFGNLTDTPPDPKKKTEIKAEDIQISIKHQHQEIQEAVRKGIVSFINAEKGYGFLTDLKSQERVFVLMSTLEEPIKERDKVFFEIERTPKGLSALNVKKVS